jgi:VWFA-related protein
VSAAVLVLAALLLAGATGPTAAQQQQEQGGASQPAGSQTPAAPPADAPGADAAQQPTFRGAIDLVRVDVFVTDGDGQPVTDLQASDFEVLEDGKAQAVEQFRVIKIDGNAPPGETPRQIFDSTTEFTEAQRDDVRVFVFFFDDYHTRDTNAIAVRKTLIEFVETHLRPTDMVAVMYPLQPVNDVEFTRNHQSIISAINNFEGRKYDYRPRNQVEANYMNQSTDVVERIRNQVVTSALEGLALRLGGVRDGRKTVIFVSEGFIVLLPPEMRRQNAQGADLPRALVGAQSDSRVEAMAEAQNRMELDSRMRDVIRAANRNNTAFYALDPRGLTPFEFDIGDGGAGGLPGPEADRRMLNTTQDTLRQLALETDGRAILNRNSLVEGLAQVVRDASYYYLIGYNTDSPADGKFHEIRVRVKRPGVSVRSRKGYWALSPENVKQLTAPRRAAAPSAVQQALASISAPVQAAKWVRTWIGTERGENGRTRVTLAWEPLPAQGGLRREQAGRVSLLAADEAGSLVYRGRSPATGSGAPAARPSTNGAPSSPGAASSAPNRIVFDAPPGVLELRLTIEAAGGGTLDNETHRIEVPDLTAPQAALSTPRVFRSRNAREFGLLVKDGDAVPVATREFSRVERLLIRFDAYGGGSETPAPTAAILGRDGQKIADVPVAAAAAGGTHQIDLGLNSMAAGEYVVEISVKDATGGSASAVIPLRIGT